MLTELETAPKEVVSCSGCGLCVHLSMLSVFRRHIAPQWKSVIHGSLLLLSHLLSLLVPINLVAVSFFLVLHSLYAKIFRILCFYAPNHNPARDQFFDNLSPKVDPSIPTVLCGDFNAVFDRGRDWAGSLLPDDTSRESTATLSRLFDSCCVVDIWLYLHPSASSFTWSRWNGSLSSHIDLVGCPYGWMSSVSSCEITPFPFSDHCAVPFYVSVPDAVPPGPGL